MGNLAPCAEYTSLCRVKYVLTCWCEYFTGGWDEKKEKESEVQGRGGWHVAEHNPFLPLPCVYYVFFLFAGGWTETLWPARFRCLRHFCLTFHTFGFWILFSHPTTLSCPTARRRLWQRTFLRGSPRWQPLDASATPAAPRIAPCST